MYDTPSQPQMFREESGCAIVSVCGPLMHEQGWWFDSYAEIRQRCAAAFASKAPTVVLEIDSPGGEVAGCFELARDLRAMATTAKKPFVAYVNGTAASAAYALACACDRIVAPDTALVGSIGVIDVLVDLTEMNKAMGVRVAVLASGKRKTDGDPDVPISPEAIAARQEIVDRLAGTFFAWVGERRGLTPEQVASYEANVFDGRNAQARKLVDGVQRMTELLAELSGQKAPARAMARTKGTRIMAMTYEEIFAELATLAAGDGDDAAKAKEALSKITAPPPADPVEPDEDDKQNEAAVAAVMRETGTKTVTDALAAVVRGVAAQATINKQQADLAAQQATLDATKRRELVAEMVKLGRETPATAWAPGADTLPDGKTPAEPWASMPIASLEARVTALRAAPAVRASGNRPPAIPPSGEGKTFMVNGQAVTLTAEQLKICEEQKCDPQTFATITASRTRA